MEGGLRLYKNEKKSETNLPLVSIITVVYNGEKHLEQTIQSILNQSYTNIEYLIIDGGSNDNTLKIIKQYDQRIDYWLSEPDKGLYFAMNKGIELAKGDIIGIVNSDDYLDENTVKYVVESSLKHDSDIFHGDMLCITESAQIRMTPDFEKMMQQPSIFHPTCFVKKTVYSTIGAFDTKYKISADYDFLLRCIKHHYKFTYIPEVLSNFRAGGMSGSCKSNIEGYYIMKHHNTGFQNQVIWRGVKCYIKTFIKKIIYRLK